MVSARNELRGRGEYADNLIGQVLSVELRGPTRSFATPIEASYCEYAGFSNRS